MPRAAGAFAPGVAQVPLRATSGLVALPTHETLASEVSKKAKAGSTLASRDSLPSATQEAGPGLTPQTKRYERKPSPKTDAQKPFDDNQSPAELPPGQPSPKIEDGLPTPRRLFASPPRKCETLQEIPSTPQGQGYGKEGELDSKGKGQGKGEGEGKGKEKDMEEDHPSPNEVSPGPTTRTPRKQGKRSSSSTGKKQKATAAMYQDGSYWKTFLLNLLDACASVSTLSSSCVTLPWFSV